MARKSNDSQRPRTRRNIVFFGETGTGKSSAINLLLDSASAPAPVSSDSQPCTRACTPYETVLQDIKHNLWDTRGLGGPRNFLEIFLGSSSEKELKKFLRERHHEIDLLVYCVRGSRATKASEKYYKSFCAIARLLAVPVVIMVTQLERENDMEDWWRKNSSYFTKSNMEFDGHACVTTLPGHSRRAESKEKLVDLIIRNYRLEANCNKSYSGSPVPRSIPPTPPRRGGIWSLFKGRPNFSDEGYGCHPSKVSSVSSSSITSSSYHTANSPVESMLPSPTVEPPTPDSMTTQMPHIDTNILGGGDQPQPHSGETSSTSPSLRSMFHPSPRSSCTSYSDAPLESCMDGAQDHLNELPFKLSAATVRRRKSWASRSGAFGDIWECDYISGESSYMVAVKAVKTNTIDHEDLRPHEKRFRRELKIWERLQHRNIVPLLGVVSGFGPLPSLVSPWYPKGSLSRYLADHQLSVPKKQRLLLDIAVGLCYLHGQDVIHGDLHSDNVLINDDGTACLTDFGLSFINDFLGTSYLKSGVCGLVPFADPALVRLAYSLQDSVAHPTKPCDIYSFGGIILHVTSGKKPYDGIPPPTIILTVLKGERPRIPTDNQHISRWHKSFIQSCWDPEERKRPLAEDLVKKLGA